MSEKPAIRVCVTGAAGLIAYALVPTIASGQCFGPDQPVALNLLDIEFATKGLYGLAMELDDMELPLVKDVVASTKLEEAFKDLDYVIMCGAFPRKQGMERKDLLAKNAAIFKEQGLALAKYAKPNVKVLVVGNPANTNAMLVQHFSGLPKENITAMTRLDHNRASNMIGRKLGVPGTSVKGLTIWGNHSPTMYPDVNQATVNGKSVRQAIEDDEFLNTKFVTDVQQRGATVIAARGSSSATSAARAALDHVRDWHCGTSDIVSMAVWSDGSRYGIPEGIIYSVPCKCPGGGVYEIVEGITVDDVSRRFLDITAQELVDEKTTAMEVCK